jgi:uncharacterized RDD family membrane protein YckC
MDAGVAAVLAALITAAGAVVAAMVMSRHKQLDTSTNLPPLPPLEPYKSAGPSRTASTTTVSPGSRIAPGVSGVNDTTVRFAGFRVRLLAGLIDGTIQLGLISPVVIWIITQSLGLGPHQPSLPSYYIGEYLGTLFDIILNQNHVSDIPLIFFSPIFLFYFVLLPSTPGKLICGLRVIRADGGRVTSLLALKRFLSYFISALPAGIGFFMIGWDDQKRALHDRICDTRVVYTPEGWRWWSRVLEY